MAFAKSNIATSVSNIANPISAFTINSHLASPLVYEYVKHVKLINELSAEPCTVLISSLLRKCSAHVVGI